MLCSTNKKTADKLIHQLNNFFSVFCSLKCCSSDDESVICSSAAKLLQFIDIQVREITHLHFMSMYILCLSFFFWKSHPSLKFKFIWGRGVSRFPDSPYEGGPPTFTLLSLDQTSITFSDKNPVSSPARISNL